MFTRRCCTWSSPTSKSMASTSLSDGGLTPPSQLRLLADWLLAVTREGAVAGGNEITLVGRERNSVPVAEITRLFVAKEYSTDDIASANRTFSIAALPDSWKDYFRERLERVRA